MKKYIIVLLTFALGFYSCEEDLVIFDTPDGFVQVAEESLSVVENSPDPVVVTVLYGGGENPNGITVNYSVSSSDPARYTLSPNSGSITIPAGQFSADIVLTPVDNFEVDGDATVTITLSTDSDAPIGIGGEENFSTTSTINIIDNDCPIDIESFVGTYTVFENFTSGNNSPSGLSNFFGETYQIELSLPENDPSGTKLILTNSDGFNEYIADGTVLVFDTCNNDISFEGGFPLLALWNVYEYTDSSYDEENFVIMGSGPFLNFGPYQFTFTKQ